MTYTILLNERAGASRFTARLEQLEHLLEDFGKKADIIPTTSEVEMRERLRELAQKNTPRVAIVGGDGTLAQAVQELAYTDTALAVLPLGTYNNFAAALNVPSDLHAALRLLWEGTVQETDLGKVQGRYFDSHYFTEAAGSGLFADFVALNSTDGQKHPLRSLYAVTRLFLVNRHYPMHLTFDGQPYHNSLSMCLVANSYRIGMAIPVASGARMNDGKLNVVVIEALDRREWIPYAKTTLAHMLQTRPKVKVFTASEIEIQSPVNMKVHCDDRFLIKTPVTISAQPKALKVLVPSV